ncbi:type IV pilus modification protein PilV [Aquabacterium sp.]|jgi:type IV pilus assembly protein PilV|uniref:type IV pilus modification protein PilV n=1 Tax=Aquabacterium sp. TaxID=1872578 RepID=UPI0025B8F80E|nr:type IV pilus modification protein PilV [Aquabacterium sp.]
MSRPFASHHPAHAQPSSRGVSLIEVLVAILVISLGILSMGAMQAQATKYTKTSEARAMGALLAGDLADRMRANRTGFLAGNYTYTAHEQPTSTELASTSCNTATSTCTAAQIAAQDLLDWRSAVYHAMPSGRVHVSSRDVTANAVDIYLIWTDPGSKGENNNERDPASLDACPTGVSGTGTRCMYFRIKP